MPCPYGNPRRRACCQPEGRRIVRQDGREFDYCRPFHRASDGEPGRVLYYNAKARVAVVEFLGGWQSVYDLEGRPVYLHQQEQTLINDA